MLYPKALRIVISLRRIFLELLICLATSNIASAAFYDRFQTESIELAHPDGFELRATLSLKKYDEPVPMLLLLQGTGCSTTSSMHITAHRLIEKYQVGVLTIDKRGTSYGIRQWFSSLGCSEEFHKYDTMQVRKEHVLWTLNRLRKSLDGWSGQLLIVGGSMGGLMGVQIANSFPNTVAVASLGTGAGLIHSKNFKPLADCYHGKNCEGVLTSQIKKIQKIRVKPDHLEDFEFYGLSEKETWWKSDSEC